MLETVVLHRASAMINCANKLQDQGLQTSRQALAMAAADADAEAHALSACLKRVTAEKMAKFDELRSGKKLWYCRRLSVLWNVH